MSDYTRKIDGLGRIVLPIEIRKELSFDGGSELKINLRNNEIIVVKKNYECIEYKSFVFDILC